MSIEDEALRRYPPEDGDTPGVDRNTSARQAYIAGASRPVTDEQVEAGAQALFDQVPRYGDPDEMWAKVRRSVARLVLEAARPAR